MLQPKPLKRKLYTLFKDITWLDFLFLVLFNLAQALIIYFGIPQIVIWIRIVLILIASGFSLLFLLKIPNSHYRAYQFLWIWFKHLVSKKKFKDKDIENLLLYKSINPSGVLLTENAINKSNKENFYSKVVKFEGNSIFKYNPAYQQFLMENLAKNLDKINFTFNIVKLQEQLNLGFNLELNNQKLSKVDPNSKTADYLKSKVENLREFENRDYESYYIIFSDNSIQKLNEHYILIKELFENSGFVVKNLNRIETLMFLNKYFMKDLSLTDIEMKLTDKDREDILINDILGFKDIEITAKYIKVDNIYYSIQSINEFDYEVENGWLNNIYNSNSNVVINLERMNEKDAEKLLESKNLTLGADMLEKSRHVVKNAKKEYEYEIFTNLIEKIAKKQSNHLFSACFYIINKAKSLEELKMLEDLNLKNAQKERIKLYNYNYEQYKCWNQLQFPINDKLKTDIQCLTELIANGWAWNLEILNDETDFLLATQTHDNSPVFFDLFLKDYTRKNSNAMIIGTSGTGKSTLAKKIALQEFYDDGQVIILDPQQEYGKLAEQTGGENIDLKNGVNTIINPLEIQLNLTENEKKAKLFSLIDNHIEFFTNWLNLLLGSLSEKERLLIYEATKLTYKKFNIYKKQSLSDLKQSKWPILSDLIKILEQTEFTNLLEKQIFETDKLLLVKKLKFFFEQQETYKNIFNQQTNINLDNHFLVFDLKALMEQENQLASQSQILLLLKIINTKLNVNNINNALIKTVLIIDEAHMFLKDTTKTLMDFILTTTKTIRKYNGSIILTTQNVEDISKNASQILSLIQYSFFFQSKDKEIKAIEELYSTTQSITEPEKQFMSSALTGECLFFLNEKQHYQIAIDYNLFEKNLLFSDMSKFKKIIKNSLIEIESLLNKIPESEEKISLINDFNQSKNDFEKELTNYEQYNNYSKFLTLFKTELYKTIY